MSRFPKLGTSLNPDFRNSYNKGVDKIDEELNKWQTEFNNVVETVSNEAFNQVVDNAKIEWLPPVNTFADLAISYPDVTEGKASMARDSGKVYRFNGTEWIEIQEIDPNAINEVDSRLSEQLAEIAYFPERFTGANDKEQLSNAISSLISGSTLKLKPNKVYNIDTFLVSGKNNITIDGQGSEIHLTNDVAEFKIIDSTRIKIKNVKFTQLTTSRNYSALLWIENVDGFIIENCEGIGSNGNFIYCVNGKNGVIRDNKINNTLADGIHMTSESKHIKVYGNKLENTADDGIAVVSYTHNAGYCENISIYENYVGQSQARGISVVGGKDISVRNNFTYETRGAGIYCAMEDASPSYSTYNCLNVEIMYNTIEKASDYDYPVSNMSSIFVRNDGLNLHDNIQIIDNTIIGGTKQAINAVNTKQLKIKGNKMKDITHHFIEVYRAENSIIVENIGNMVGLIDFNGVFIRESKKVTISENILNDVGSRGIYVLGTTTYKSENIHVENNLITNPNTTNTTKDGILIDYVDNVLVGNNNIQATNTLRCAVLVTTNVSGSVVVDNNNYSNTEYTSNPVTVSTNAIKKQKITKTGIATFSGDGVTRQFNIPHGLIGTPNYYQVMAGSIEAGNAKINYVAVNSTNLVVLFDVAPVTGTSNIKLTWLAEL